MIDSLVRMYANAISQMIDAGWQPDNPSDQAWCGGHTSFTHPDFTDPDEKDIIDITFEEVPIR